MMLTSRCALALAISLFSALASTGCGGEPGPAGANGTNGLDGKDGVNGTDGTDGTNGKDGVNGTNGKDGVDGTNGTNGVDGKDGVDGATGTDGANGTNGTDGKDGVDGKDGTNGGNAEVAVFHGRAALMAKALSENAQFPAVATITSATADVNGLVTVEFSVDDALGNPVLGLPSLTASIARLAPPAAGQASTSWVPYIYRSETVSGSATGDWPNPDGTQANQAYGENNGTLTDHGDGTYTYAYATNISNAKTPVGGTAIAYDRAARHRVAIMMGGKTGATADAILDFVPDGSAFALSRDIVRTQTCQSCHGPSFAVHGGSRMSAENCVTCHAPGSKDAQSGESLDFTTMVHKIHAGGELRSIPGPDGIVWDNPATVANEAADNGRYAIWGNHNERHEWWKSTFPAVLANCQKCHEGTGTEVSAWKQHPSRSACGSCHDNVDFATGTNHDGGQQTNDDNCALCHKAEGNSVGKSVTVAHDWTVKDPRNIPEFDVNVSISTPANGTHFVAGESPVITVVLKDLENGGAVIDHSALTADSSAEGCTSNPCPSRDGLLTASNLFVHGPRGDQNPVLTTRARARITSAGFGPFDISAAGATLDIRFDGGSDLYSQSNGGSILPGTVSVPVSSGTFASTAAVTCQEIVTWLNSNANFRKRGIAYLEPGGQVSIRSRNLGKLYSVQLLAGTVTTAVFAGDTSVRVVGGSTPAVSIAHQSNPANNDPKVFWSYDRITYTLDPVDDLRPGTYAVTLEISDRGRKSATDYKTPSVKTVTFQVGTATEEQPPARGCNSCHQAADGRGMVLDYSRHNKGLGDLALDQCGACHDYQSQLATGQWSGAHPISKRVHAVHDGANLNYPLATVSYANGDPVAGRNWDITYPQDVRGCESCHAKGTTSGTWTTKASRLPCWGCHDSDSARAHMKLQTWDPTPADPWSGDEEESCTTCH